MRLATIIIFALLHMIVKSARRPVKKALDHEAFDRLISCLKATGEQWWVSIDDGVVVLQNESNNMNLTSTAAEDCIGEAVEHLNIRFEDNDVYTNTVSAEDANAAWAESQGADGLVYVNYEDSRMLAKRQIDRTDYYGIGCDDDGRRCVHSNFNLCYKGECRMQGAGCASV
ncbi:uncharacterized protein LTR77_007460 [Saxophila tyrrhenica]|uniref:Uncharacterized protein n=1 Tax=Saxophila tyrrhenica TaxID=1690608 RepID=A0AAV9P4U1_9PEZI|nr:hypothetical protein LTR77_007460 [Saxophila tyrrhenica]